MKLVGFRPEHLIQIKPQPAQRDAHKNAWRVCREAANHPSVSWIDGRVIACAGMLPNERGGLLWAVLSETGPQAFRRIHRDIKWIIGYSPYERLEMYIGLEFGNGHRWALALGFTPEAITRDDSGKYGIRYVRKFQ